MKVVLVDYRQDGFQIAKWNVAKEKEGLKAYRIYFDIAYFEMGGER